VRISVPFSVSVSTSGRIGEPQPVHRRVGSAGSLVAKASQGCSRQGAWSESVMLGLSAVCPIDSTAVGTAQAEEVLIVPMHILLRRERQERASLTTTA